MTDEQLSDFLRTEFAKSSRSLTKRLGSGRLQELAAFIMRKTAFIDSQKSNAKDQYSWLYRICCILRGMTDFPICRNPSCGKKIDGANGFLGKEQGFRAYCSLRCAVRSPDVIRHRAETCMRECGVRSKSMLESTKQKIKATQKINGSVEKTLSKGRATRYAKNGGRWHGDDFGRKVKAAKVANGHPENWNNYDKIQQTITSRYGVNCAFNIKSVRDRSNVAIHRRSFERMARCPYDEPLFTLDEYIGRKDDGAMLTFRCRKCGNAFSSMHHDGYHSRCPRCWPKVDGVSRLETELREFVQSCLPACEIASSARTVIPPQELDIYVPEKKLAIEFDGLYWHSDAVRRTPMDYHLKKTEACEKLGIRLVHVFEDEWNDKQEIVKSRLRNLFGLYSRTVYARKCEVREVGAQAASAFLDENHLQGAVCSPVRFGLYYGDELVALMTFGKCRFDKRHEWELVRFCPKLNTCVVGAAGKLLSHFNRNYGPKSIVTYADRRWSDGNLYKKLGFAFVRNSPPNYWYTDNMVRRYSRIMFQKHKLRGLLEKFDESKSEAWNMRDNGYFRVFDCGNMVFEKVYSGAEFARR